MALTEINDSTFSSEINKGMVLVDCWAEWCGPCRMVSPVLEELSSEMNEILKIKKLNVDDNQDTAQKLNIQSLPTLLLFKDGQLVDKIIGALPKAQIKSFIERHK
ncbi:thioredoxin [Leptospira dzoumogneensis]|uniref:Thioredoxin n=1 Tax=Leptospira dzoumogneensis TaxID=2484904 RepID=A0A4Z1AFQ7_9LEPT|nr:thioredoxin [Leptospira dzoumogneensis]TGN02067.1 thioredoxin [Leptospira dzoumogneensis]